MGNTFVCSKERRPKKLDTLNLTAQKFKGQFELFELDMLLLIYRDLSARANNNLISRDVFNSYFKIIGLWGEQIFNKFVHKQEDFMNFEEFLIGMELYIKCSEEEKIHNLFKLYDLKNQNGIIKEDFLQMLHNYPKEELKRILDDQLFLEDQQIIKAYDRSKKVKPRKGSQDLLEMSLQMIRKYSQNISENREIGESQNRIKIPEGIQSMNSRASDANLFPVDSMVQHNGIPMKGFGVNITVMVNGQKIEMHANLNLLIKKYVDMVYKAKNDLLISLEEFKIFVKKHPNLLLPLYSAFNYNVWGIREQEPLYKNMSLDMNGELYLPSKKNTIKTRYCELYPHVLMEFEKKHLQKPKKIICLQGLIVEERVDYASQKFGFEIFHINKKYKNRFYNCPDEVSYRNWQTALQAYFNGEINKKYSILERLGEGKYSIVYKCQNKVDRQNFALKIINKTNLQSEEQDIVKHEVSIMKLMNHSCIAKLIDTIENRNHLYLVTELIVDGDLFDYVQNKQYLEESEAAIILTQLIDATKYIHSIGIVHRDIKPENIMIILSNNYVQQVKLIDFGFANYMNKIQNERRSYNCGTLNYVAPEALVDKDQPLTYKMDNFALGVILYYMLSGYLPFDSDIPQEIIQNTIDGVYSMDDEFWKCVSDEARDLVAGLLNTNVEKRFTLDQAKEHKWIKDMLAKRQQKYK